MKGLISAAVLALVAGGGVCAAQSLGDVARQEESRRKAVKAPGKVYTNDNLRDAGPPPAPRAPASVPAAAPPSPSGAATAAPEPAGGDAAPPAASNEAAWRQRITAARDTLSRAQIFQDALQSRINGLTTDFTARDDPAQRAVIATDRQKALAELDRVKQEIVQTRKAIADIQEEARRAGVPAGWVR